MKKQIVIHVGPPKTGTSAAQKWLNENHQFLQENGVFYPQHDVDSNHISSGNLLSIYDLDASNQLCFKQDKLTSLLKAFAVSGCHTLLFSSEFFFRRMPELVQFIPDALFVAYVRNPLEVKESNYNQSVKRHFQTEPFNHQRTHKLAYMETLVEFARHHAKTQLRLRLYGEPYFQGGSIVSDLLSLVGVNVKVSLTRVNSSYHFEALEFKRWFNQFKRDDYQGLIDRALQRYDNGTADYSLLPKEQYLQDNAFYSEILENYAKQLGQINLVPKFKALTDPTPKPYYPQALSDEGFLSVCKFLQQDLGRHYALIVEELKDDYAEHQDKYFELFIGSISLRYHYANWLVKWVSRGKAMIKKATQHGS